MTTGRPSLRDDAAAIGEAAIAAVRPERLLASKLGVSGDRLLVAGMPLAAPPMSAGGRVVIVGGGKAAAGLAAGVAGLLAAAGVGRDRVTGLVSVPEGSGRTVPGVDVRCTRPAAVNLPTPAVVAATREMESLLESLTAADLAVAVISGGGSALLEAPRAGVPLDEVIAVARFLSAAGADIHALNAVRRAASDVKGGGLARVCRAGHLVAVVLSDVIGDPLEDIASGPCWPVSGGVAEAVTVLERTGAVAAGVAPRLVAVLREDLRLDDAVSRREPVSPTGSWASPAGCQVAHVLLVGNLTAVEAAAAAAATLGYMVTIRQGVGGTAESADDVGRRLARDGVALVAAAAADGRPRAIIEGGEAVVRLPADHGRGGRNQQTAAAALVAGLRRGTWPPGLLVASIGTDGEDGPTAAAGGLADAAVAAAIAAAGLDAAAAVARCDAGPLLERAEGLIVTGPTGTNVADVRLVLARP